MGQINISHGQPWQYRFYNETPFQPGRFRASVCRYIRKATKTYFCGDSNTAWISVKFQRQICKPIRSMHNGLSCSFCNVWTRCLSPCLTYKKRPSHHPNIVDIILLERGKTAGSVACRTVKKVNQREAFHLFNSFCQRVTFTSQALFLSLLQAKPSFHYQPKESISRSNIAWQRTANITFNIYP